MTATGAVLQSPIAGCTMVAITLNGWVMGKSSSVIEINGNQYDAITGQLIGSAKRLVSKATKSSFRNIDGFVRKSAAKVSVRPSSQNVHKGAERAKTLMRSGVTKPVGKIINKSKLQKSTTGLVAAIHPQRAQRAANVHLHKNVSRFGSLSSQPTPTVTQTVEVTARPIASKTRAVSTAITMPSMVTSASHQHLERLLDHALFRADAHKQALHGHHPGQSRWRQISLMPRWVSITAISLILLLIGGFFAWQNIPQVSMKLAATKAHISASVPAYSPSGFKFAGPIKYENGVVAMNFVANADPNRSFTILQRASELDSASLLANYINPSRHTFQTSQVKGATVYIHGENNDATWVSNGIMYSIEDRANLNSDQLLKIIGSM